MPMISYAQNAEDVLLHRAFPHRNGFFIDVGAADPVEFSVTKHFSNRGWTGLNLEPQPYYFDRLKADRPRDVNLRVAVSDRPGTLTLHVSPTHRGFSTADASVAAGMTARGIEHHPITVPALTLTELCATYAASRTIDFLKIDVEGAEQAVLAGMDFRVYRPRIVLVEATEQNSRVPNFDAWEPRLIEADYRVVWFDGLNRFYCRAEEPGLAAAFETPPNIFDDFIPWRFQETIDALREDNARLRHRMEHLEAALAPATRRAGLRRRIRGWMRFHVPFLSGLLQPIR